MSLTLCPKKVKYKEGEEKISPGETLVVVDEGERLSTICS